MRGFLRRSLKLVVLAGLLSAAPAFAVNRTWTGGGADDNWTTAANWGGTAPSAGDDLEFPGGTPRLSPNNDFPAGTSFASIAFTGLTGGYTLTGNGVQLVTGLTAGNSTGNSTVQLPITLAGPLSFTVLIAGPSDRLTVSGAVDTNGNTLSTNPLGGSILNLNGVISGAGQLIQVGPGVTFVVANMTYTGATTVNSGNFVLAGASLSPSSPVTVNGGLIQYDNDAASGDLNALGGTVGCEGGGTNQTGHVANLDLQGASTLQMQMVSVTNYGKLITTGDVTLNNPTLFLGFNFTSATGDAFTIISNGGGSVGGAFSGLPEGATLVANGRTYQITYVGGDGNDVVVTDITVGGPTPTPTATVVAPTATATPAGAPTVTATPPGPTPTPGPGPVAPVPTLSTDLLVLLGLALALVAVLLMRKSG